jgi:hypothetical protein
MHSQVNFKPLIIIGVFSVKWTGINVRLEHVSVAHCVAQEFFVQKREVILFLLVTILDVVFSNGPFNTLWFKLWQMHLRRCVHMLELFFILGNASIKCFILEDGS